MSHVGYKPVDGSRELQKTSSSLLPSKAAVACCRTQMIYLQAGGATFW